MSTPHDNVTLAGTTRSLTTRGRARIPHVNKTMRDLITTQTKSIADRESERITVPTTLLWGRHDRMVPLSVGEAAAARHGWPLRDIDHAAHALTEKVTPWHVVVRPVELGVCRS